MTARLTFIPFYMLTFFILAGCGRAKNKADNATTEKTFIKELKEIQIGKSDYYISIPTNYSIKETEGPDFFVYSLYQTDTTRKAKFSGGLYFGNHPSQFEPDNDRCKIENSQSKILNENANWTIYNCNNDYSIQTIIDNKGNEGWNEMIHAFGRANSLTDINNILSIFSTMKKKK